MIQPSHAIGIWGFGVVGKSAYTYLLGKARLEVLDSKPLSPADRELLAQHGTPSYAQDDLMQFLERNDYIIPSPGINLHPYQAYRHKWLSELDLFAAAYKKPIIAITGTIGKTSTTHLLGQLLNAAGMTTAVGGNIGIGMLDLLAQPSQAALLELSSFQLQLNKSFAPDLAIWTNFFPNHLDRHVNEQEYFDAKAMILAHQTSQHHALLPLTIINRLQSHDRYSFFSVTPPSPDLLQRLTPQNRLYYNEQENILLLHNGNKTVLMPQAALPSISYTENWLIICAALDLLNIPLDIITAYSSTLTLPEHRLEKITTHHAVDIYNDSKSTTPEATLAALAQLNKKPTHLLLGGISKGIDRTPLIQQLKGKVVHIYMFGKEAEQLHALAQACGIASSCHASLDDAVAACLHSMQPGSQMIFSPAGASFDLFSNYIERGNYFKKLIKNSIHPR